jgi:hypothetical protein
VGIVDTHLNPFNKDSSLIKVISTGSSASDLGFDGLSIPEEEQTKERTEYVIA